MASWPDACISVCSPFKLRKSPLLSNLVKKLYGFRHFKCSESSLALDHFGYIYPFRSQHNIQFIQFTGCTHYSLQLSCVTCVGSWIIFPDSAMMIEKKRAGKKL